MQCKTRGNEYRTTIVCVDEYRQRIPEGRIYNPYLPAGETYRGLMEFLLKMEELLDAMQFPQSFTVARCFSAPPPIASQAPDPQIREGRRGTFAIRVLFRQNASWQGSLTWLEEDREESFRSVLELLLLLHSALEAET